MTSFSRLLAACAAAAATSASAHATTFVVTQTGFGFTPANITINVGDTVQWNWQSLDHDVTEGTDGVINGNELFTFPLGPGNPVVTFTFTPAFIAANPMPNGLYNYFCSIHFPLMTGTITVSTDPGTAYCFGDGSATACPCGNSSSVGTMTGCTSSLGIGGKLTGAGSPSVSADTVVLNGANMPNAPALYFQGTLRVAAGAGAVFGDGLRCAAGTVIRLGTKANAAGSSSYPGPGDAPVSVKGAVAAGDTRDYQVWYRNAAAFCTPSTFNLTNGYELNWGP